MTPRAGTGAVPRGPVVQPQTCSPGGRNDAKDFIARQGVFEDLGLKCVGPIDGHDTEDSQDLRLGRRRPSGLGPSRAVPRPALDGRTAI
ncbi:1-deoxy-D-xylulose-5-phosphate synthase N-terminal domain-containing protein [Streptomyces sp. NPDC020377]|uniref:1-deoxy-D-xylulose-5-phosphate synthase N-terminal domain-containing protein n=1 Tax=Streptomyces sp. NPDC020377 TaxID=3365070 RepID=UPI0009987D68